MLGILLSLSSCIGPVLHSPCSVSLRDSMSNGSSWHVIPMFSGGSRYVSTSPVWRFSSKFDVLKNLLSARLLNSILPSVFPSWSLFSIRSPTLVLQRSGTYQSRLMVSCCHRNSLMVSSLVLCSSIVGVVAWSVVFCTCSGFALLSTRCAMAFVWTPILFSVDIPFLAYFRLPAFLCGVCVVLSVSNLNSLGCCLHLFSLVARGQLSVKSLFSILIGFYCERVNAWWYRSNIFEIISWLP